MLIVGLGNPTQKYENTLHNMGYMTVDMLAKQWGKTLKNAECSSVDVVFSKQGESIILAKPITFMNASGQAVKSLMAKYNQTADDLIVIYDDIDIPRFSVRIRERGSAGTHNGMKNIVEMIGTSDFKRVRMGIGKNEFDLSDYVLSKVSGQTLKLFENRAEQTAVLLKAYLEDRNFEKLMREGNVIHES